MALEETTGARSSRTPRGAEACGSANSTSASPATSAEASSARARLLRTSSVPMPTSTTVAPQATEPTR